MTSLDRLLNSVADYIEVKKVQTIGDMAITGISIGVIVWGIIKIAGMIALTFGL